MPEEDIEISDNQLRSVMHQNPFHELILNPDFVGLSRQQLSAFSYERRHQQGGEQFNADNENIILNQIQEDLVPTLVPKSSEQYSITGASKKGEELEYDASEEDNVSLTRIYSPLPQRKHQRCTYSEEPSSDGFSTEVEADWIFIGTQTCPHTLSSHPQVPQNTPQSLCVLEQRSIRKGVFRHIQTGIRSGIEKAEEHTRQRASSDGRKSLKSWNGQCRRGSGCPPQVNDMVEMGLWHQARSFCTSWCRSSEMGGRCIY